MDDSNKIMQHPHYQKIQLLIKQIQRIITHHQFMKCNLIHSVQIAIINFMSIKLTNDDNYFLQMWVPIILINSDPNILDPLIINNWLQFLASSYFSSFMWLKLMDWVQISY